MGHPEYSADIPRVVGIDSSAFKPETFCKVSIPNKDNRCALL